MKEIAYGVGLLLASMMVSCGITVVPPTAPGDTPAVTADPDGGGGGDSAVADAGTPPTDEGTPPTDEGTPPIDEGTPPTDEGTPPTDEGTPPTDEGTPPTDEGTPPTDEGTPPTDEGTPPTDEGMPDPDAGVVTPECVEDSDCPPAADLSPCKAMACASGSCAEVDLPDGSTCEDPNPCATCQSGQCAAPPLWEKTYGDAKTGGAFHAVAAAPGGLYFAGQRHINGNDNLLVVRTAPDGTPQWEKTYGSDSTFETGEALVVLADGGAAVAGRVYAGPNKEDAWLVRIDGSGKEVFVKSYGGAGYDSAADVALLSNGFVIAGSNGSKGSAGSDDMWLVRTDALGNVLWDKVFGGAGPDYGAAVEPVAGGFIFAGTKEVAPDNRDAHLVRTDKDGNVLWESSYGTDAWEIAFDVAVLPDGFAVVGRSQAKGYDGWIVRVDSKGELVWEKTYGTAKSEELRAVVALADGGLAAAGYGQPNPVASFESFWLVEVSPDGGIVFERDYGTMELTETANGLVALPDGFVLAGSTSDPLKGGGSPFAVRVDAKGNLSCAGF